jgi:2-keto-4-pentenoate hydratase/2-oxohepta-3-ene-1,7-dioic acid hydratase in catechol pathway
VTDGATGDGGTVVDASAVALHAPAVHRPRIACAAGNYAMHVLGSAKRKGIAESNALAGLVEPGAMPTADEVVAKTRQRGVPRGFWKDFAVPRGSGDDIPYPDRCERLDYEGEVVAVIGRRAKDVPAGQGGRYVWGVSLHNDWSIRQQGSKGNVSFNLSKNWDGSASVGPCIVVGDIEPGDIDVETRVNGELRQKYNSGDMIFSHADYIEYLSRDFVLLPGDMISGGSGPGTATDAEKNLSTGEDVSEEERAALYLRIGDVVEVSSPAIGNLRNRVAAKDD